MRDRLADPVFDVVACALAINDRLGGRQVSQVLDRLADATRAQLRIQHEVRAQQGADRPVGAHRGRRAAGRAGRTARDQPALPEHLRQCRRPDWC